MIHRKRIAPAAMDGALCTFEKNYKMNRREGEFLQS